MTSTTAVSSNDHRTQALEELVDQHGDYLYRYALRLVSLPEKADEAVQETFLAACESWERFRGAASAKSWLVSILRRKISDQLRLKYRDERYFSPNDSADELEYFDPSQHWTKEHAPIASSFEPEKQLVRAQLAAALQECLRSLTEKSRTLFLLRETDDCDRSELAKLFELSESNVGVLLYRARIALQQCMNKKWSNEDNS